MRKEPESEENTASGYRLASAYYTKCLMEIKILKDNAENDVDPDEDDPDDIKIVLSAE
jgi:hypothetical protein